MINEKGKKVPLSLCYPPPHLYHILFELFKNSMRATVETHGTSDKLPDIEVLLAKGEHDVSIRVSDQVHFVDLTRVLPDTDLAGYPAAGYPSNNFAGYLAKY